MVAQWRGGAAHHCRDSQRKVNSGRRYEYRQKFLGDDECLVQKKKFSLYASVRLSVHQVTPDNFSVFARDAQNEVVGVTI